MTTVTPAQQGIIDAVDAYNKFGNDHVVPDANNLNDKLSQWLEDVKDKKKDPSILLELFFTVIMASGSSQGGLSGDGSITHNEENSLSEVAKELNYASAYRNVIADIKNNLTHPVNPKDPTDPNAPAKAAQQLQDINNDLDIMDQYRTKMYDGKYVFYDHQQIFQNSDGTFDTAESNIRGILNKIGDGKAYSSLYNLSDLAQQKADPNNPNSAANDFQTFSNGCDTLFSAVGVQQNVLSTQMQDTQSDIKSNYSVISQAIEAYLKLNSFSIQKQISN